MTAKSDLPALLSAASVLVAILTFLYGLLYPELSSASALRLAGRHVDDVGADRERVRAARLRAVFLVLAAVTIGLVFAPVAVDRVCNFVGALDDVSSAFDDYNPLATSLVVITIGCFFIAAHAAYMVVRLTRTLGQLSG